MNKKCLSLRLAALVLFMGFALTTFIGCPPTITKVTEYTVTFKSDGQVINQVKVIEAAKAAKPADPVKEGYKFLGWYEEGAVEAFDFETLITKDTTLTAKWEKIHETSPEDTPDNPDNPPEETPDNPPEETPDNPPEETPDDPPAENPEDTPAVEEYTVTFKNGEETPATEKVKKDEKAKKPADPVKEGYKFLGWFAEGAASAYDFNAKITKDITLTAKWEKLPVEYTVTFVNGNETPVKEKVTEGNSVAKPTDPVKEGYNFLGWFEESAASAYDFNAKITKDITLTAKWEEVPPEEEPPETKEYTVTFKNGNETYETITVEENTMASQPTVPVKEGYTFLGWYLTNSLAAFDFTTIITKNVTLYAKWIEGSPDDLVIEATENGFKFISCDYHQDNDNVAIFIDGKFYSIIGKNTFTAINEGYINPIVYSLVIPGKQYTFSFVQYKSSDYQTIWSLPQSFIENNLLTKAPITAIGGSGEVSITNADILNAYIDWENDFVKLDGQIEFTGLHTGDVITYGAAVVNNKENFIFIGESSTQDVTYSWNFPDCKAWQNEYTIHYYVNINGNPLTEEIISTVKNPLIGKKMIYTDGSSEEKFLVFTENGLEGSLQGFNSNKCYIKYFNVGTKYIAGYQVTFNHSGYYVIENDLGIPFMRILGEDTIEYADINSLGMEISFGTIYPLEDAYNPAQQKKITLTVKEPEDIKATMNVHNNELTLSVPNDYTEVMWEIFGITLNGNIQFINIENKSSGKYTCFVKGTKNGIIYSESFIFTLTKE